MYIITIANWFEIPNLHVIVDIATATFVIGLILHLYFLAVVISKISNVVAAVVDRVIMKRDICLLACLFVCLFLLFVCFIFLVGCSCPSRCWCRGCCCC